MLRWQKYCTFGGSLECESEPYASQLYFEMCEAALYIFFLLFSVSKPGQCIPLKSRDQTSNRILSSPSLLYLSLFFFFFLPALIVS